MLDDDGRLRTLELWHRHFNAGAQRGQRPNRARQGAGALGQQAKGPKIDLARAFKSPTLPTLRGMPTQNKLPRQCFIKLRFQIRCFKILKHILVLFQRNDLVKLD